MKLEPVDIPSHVIYKWRHTVYADHINGDNVSIYKAGEEPSISEIMDEPEIIKTRLALVWRFVKDE